MEKCEQPIMDEKLLNRIKSGEEVWVPVKGYENDYMVSSNGTVKRINRFSKTGRRLPDLLMQQHIDSRSGRRVDVSLKGSSKSLHKIVFESFYNITVSKGYEYTIDHIDTNPLNNSILNLRLCNGIRDNMLNNPLTRLHKCQQQGHNQKLITDCTDLENEIWKPCIGYEGLYLISNKGRIKAEERIIIEKNTNIVRRKKSHLMRLHNKDNMYYTIGLIDKHGKHKNHYVHKLEFESFYGKVKEGNEIDHIDSNSLNNNLENLRECSHKENCANVNSIIKRKISLKNNNKTVVGINLLLVDENNYVLKEFVSYKDAALYFNVHHSAIERYINKKTKRLKCLPDKMNLIRKEQNGVINA